MRSNARGDLEGPEDQQLPQQPLAESWEVFDANDGDGGSNRSMLLLYTRNWWLFTVDKKGDGPR